MLRQQKKNRGRVAGVSPFRRSASSLNPDQLLGLTNEYMTTCDWKIPINSSPTCPGSGDSGIDTISLTSSSLASRTVGSVSTESLAPESSCFSRSVSMNMQTPVKEYDTKIKNLEKENFDLRLRIFLLEERLGFVHNKDTLVSDKDIETELQLRECKKSLNKCIELVEDAAIEIQFLEQKLDEQKSEFDEQLLKAEIELSLQRLEENKYGNLLLITEDQEDKSSSCDMSLIDSYAKRLLSRNISEIDEVGSTNYDNLNDDYEPTTEAIKDTDTLKHKEEIRSMRESYHRCSQSYRCIIKKMDERLHQAEICWKEAMIEVLFLKRLKFLLISMIIFILIV